MCVTANFCWICGRNFWPQKLYDAGKYQRHLWCAPCVVFGFLYLISWQQRALHKSLHQHDWQKQESQPESSQQMNRILDNWATHQNGDSPIWNRFFKPKIWRSYVWVKQKIVAWLSGEDLLLRKTADVLKNASIFGAAETLMLVGPSRCMHTFTLTAWSTLNWIIACLKCTELIKYETISCIKEKELIKYETASRHVPHHSLKCEQKFWLKIQNKIRNYLECWPERKSCTDDEMKESDIDLKATIR